MLNPARMITVSAQAMYDAGKGAGTAVVDTSCSAGKAMHNGWNSFAASTKSVWGGLTPSKKPDPK